MEEIEVSIEELRLDPENPRFGLNYVKMDRSELVESDEKVRARILNDPTFDVGTLVKSIQESDF